MATPAFQHYQVHPSYRPDVIRVAEAEDLVALRAEWPEAAEAREAMNRVRVNHGQPPLPGYPVEAGGATVPTVIQVGLPGD